MNLLESLSREKGSFSKEIYDIKKNQIEIELKNIITKINSMYGLNIRMQGTEERIRELPDRTIEITQFKQQRK